jgi:uncharacterized protein
VRNERTAWARLGVDSSGTVGLSTVAREHGSSSCPDARTLTGPVRTCVGCRERAAKRELVRVTAGSDVDGHPAVLPDPDGTATGRGAHLHPTAECYELAVRRKAFSRALRFAGDSGAALSSAPLAHYLDQHLDSRAPQALRP